jgi:hypothetical protein
LGAVAALVLTAVPGTAAAAPQQAAPQQQATDEITLVTGDKVLLGHNQQVLSIQPGEGRTSMRFHAYRSRDGHTTVIPEDALGPLAADRLDRRLFDVTTLLEFGYRDRMPLIVDGQARVGARTSNEWATLRSASNSGVKVWLDGIRKPSLDRSVTQIGAPAVHERGITGKGVKVAIVDTGVDQNHPDLKGQEIAERNFTDDPDTTDNVGHGTHVGSTVASSGSKYGGVAPGAQLLDAKVCVEFGCQESWILDGMRWAVEQGAQVVNLSLGGRDTPEIDPLEQAINDLTAKHGTLFVVAAGNSGAPGTVSSPSTADAALSVGAVDRDDKLAPFSSKGPRTGDGGVKPEVTAPGVGIVAAKAGTAEHLAASGTSMATPHVAGAAALLRQQHPDWTPAQLKSALASTAKPTPGLSAYDQGAGRIDVSKAINQVLVGDVTVNLGRHQWPHGDDKPETRNVTYTNPTDAPVTLDVKLTTGAPAGMFTLGASKVTVPAKGTATVPVTGDTRVGTQDGTYTGEIVATSGTHVVRTLAGVDREVESYDLTINLTDRSGADPAGDQLSVIIGVDNPVFEFVFGTGDQKIRLPKGKYMIDSSITTADGRDKLIRPTVELSGDVTVDQDARLAKPLSVKAPEPTGDFTLGMLSWHRNFEDGGSVFAVSTSLGGFDRMGTAQLGGSLPPEEMSSITALHANSANDPGRFFRLAYPVGGGIPTGLTEAPSLNDLARVESGVSGLKPGSVANVGQIPTSVHGHDGATVVHQAPETGKTVNYVTTEGMRWQTYAISAHANGASEDVITPRRGYEAGRTYRETLFRPVFSPSLPETSFPFAQRSGSDLSIRVPMLGDATNGEGGSTVDSARTALYRDGVLVGELPQPGGFFSGLPAREAGYRAEVSLDRSSKFEFSTKVSAVWNFRSKASDAAVVLPLSVVRFAPKLDDNGAVPAGTLQRIGLLTQSQGDTGAVRITGVSYSHDDGKSWRNAGVVGNNALIYHPADAKWTSLKATAKDAKGNTVELTVIRAYKVG